MPTFGQDQEEEAFCELRQRFVDQREIMGKAFFSDDDFFKCSNVMK